MLRQLTGFTLPANPAEVGIGEMIGSWRAVTVTL